MSHAGLIDVWHLLLAILARQTPVIQIMIVEGAVLFAVMAAEGVRSSILAMLKPVHMPQTSTNRSPTRLRERRQPIQ